MKEKLLKYSVLRYSPSTIAGEKINLGIMYYDVESGYREFKYIKKFSRLSSFDDEINLSMVKKLLQSIADDVEGNLFTYDKFDIEQYTKYFVSDFSFDKPKTIVYETLNEMIVRLHKMYFRFEYEKKERPSKDDDKNLIENLIITNGKDVRKDVSVIGSSNEKIKYDFVTTDKCIKIFDYDDKNLNMSINSAKTWAWNALQEKKMQTVIIYRYNEEYSKYNNEFKIIMDIFNKSNAKVYDIEDAIQEIQDII